MRRPALLAVYGLLALAIASHALGQTTSNTSSLELRISGPRLIRRGDKLTFRAVIINHSSKPVAFAFRRGGWDCDGVFRWTITDAGDRELPLIPHETDRHSMICCLTSGLSERDIVVLQPGESRDTPILTDPSDIYAFPRNGFYKVTLRFGFDPSGQADSLRPPGPTPHMELARQTGALGLTSNVWNLYLAD